MPLCFNRYEGQSIVIGDVQIDVVETHRSYVKLRVHAPDGVTILRGKLAATMPAPAPAAPSEPRTGNPSRVVAASAPAAGAVCEPPPAAGGGGAEGTQGGPPRRRVLSPPPPLKRPKQRR